MTVLYKNGFDVSLKVALVLLWLDGSKLIHWSRMPIVLLIWLAQQIQDTFLCLNYSSHFSMHSWILVLTQVNDFLNPIFNLIFFRDFDLVATSFLWEFRLPFGLWIFYIPIGGDIGIGGTMNIDAISIMSDSLCLSISMFSDGVVSIIWSVVSHFNDIILIIIYKYYLNIYNSYMQHK